jgi:membrane-associated HD superfamily phosphohydrolase
VKVCVLTLFPSSVLVAKNIYSPRLVWCSFPTDPWFRRLVLSTLSESLFLQQNKRRFKVCEDKNTTSAQSKVNVPFPLKIYIMFLIIFWSFRYWSYFSFNWTSNISYRTSWVYGIYFLLTVHDTWYLISSWIYEYMIWRCLENKDTWTNFTVDEPIFLLWTAVALLCLQLVVIYTSMISFSCWSSFVVWAQCFRS